MHITVALFIAYKSIISIGNLVPVDPFSPAMLHMFTRVYLCLPSLLVHVYLCLPYLLVLTYVYSCLPMYASLLMFTYVYHCLHVLVCPCLFIFTCVYTFFTNVYPFLLILALFTRVYLYLLVLNYVYNCILVVTYV